MPVIRTGVYPHMPIVVTGQFVTPASTRCALPKLCTFWPWGLTLSQSSRKGETTCYPPRSTILPNFIALHQPSPEIFITKVSADKETNKCFNKKHIAPYGPCWRRENRRKPVRDVAELLCKISRQSVKPRLRNP